MRQTTHRHPGIETLETRIAPATFTWDGGGADHLWSTPENWVDDVAPPADGIADIVFPANVNQTATLYDFPDDSTFGTITLGGPGYVIDPADSAHDSIALHGGIKTTGESGAANIVNTRLTLMADCTIGAIAPRTLQVNGDIAGDGHSLLLSGQYDIEFAGALSEITSLTSTGPTIAWKSDQPFTGDLNLLRGKLYLEGSANPALAGALQIGDASNSVPVAFVFVHSSTDLGAIPVKLSGGVIHFGDHNASLASLSSEQYSYIDLGTAHLNVAGDVRLEGSQFSVTLDPTSKTAPISVAGNIELRGGLALSWSSIVSLPAGTRLHLIDHSGPSAVDGAFGSFLPGDLRNASGVPAQLNYRGGDGNDIDVLVGQPTIQISMSGLSASYLDVDGDRVTISTTAGNFTPGSFHLAWGTGVANGIQLEDLNLDATFAGAAIKLVATPTKLGGDGRVNVGHIQAKSSLESILVPGDLGRFNLETASTSIIHLLKVSSLGVRGLSTQDSVSASLVSHVAGRVSKLSVLGSMRNATVQTDLGVGTVMVGGNMTDAHIFAGQLADVKVLGSIRATSDGNGAGFSAGRIGSIFVGRSILGSVEHPVWISALAETSTGTSADLIIRSLSVGGNVNRAIICAGLSGPEGTGNPDASIGYINVGGNWVASSISAGVDAGTDGMFGTADDRKTPPTGSDKPALTSEIESVIIRGVVKGTADDTTDSFGIVAEDVQRLQIHGIVFPLHIGAGTSPDIRALASTGPGVTGTKSDVMLRECRQ